MDYSGWTFAQVESKIRQLSGALVRYSIGDASRDAMERQLAALKRERTRRWLADNR